MVIYSAKNGVSFLADTVMIMPDETACTLVLHKET